MRLQTLVSGIENLQEMPVLNEKLELSHRMYCEIDINLAKSYCFISH